MKRVLMNKDGTIPLADFRKILEEKEKEIESLKELVAKCEELEKENNELKVQLEKAHVAYRAVRKINNELMNGYVC